MPQAPTDTLNLRHAAVRRELADRKIDALVVTSLANILYLTNFTGSSAIVVLTADRLLFLTDFRYVTSIESTRGTRFECPSLDLVRVEGSYDEALANVLEDAGGEKAGFEGQHLTVSRHQWLEATLARAGSKLSFMATDGIVERARLIKDAYEIAKLREAARRLSEVAKGVIAEDVKRGLTETDIAERIEARLRRGGFQKPAFDTIVASGPNGALPHARPGERKLAEGDLVTLDFGGVYDSYCVDLTRTVSVGTPDSRSREVYDAVLEAHDRAIAAVVPGRSRFDIDRAARDVLTGRGLGEAFGHGTGHGLGIDVHEDPRITRLRADETPSDRDNVRPGMIFTIEPGAYLPGWGGVRIEDDVLVTASGVEVLTQVDTELIHI